MIDENDLTTNESIDRKLKQYFDGKIVRKDLTKKIKEGANVPVYVLEFLLGQYCSSDDEAIVEDGLNTVKKILADNYVRPDEAQKIMSLLRQRGSYTVIDKITVHLNIKNDVYEAEFSNLGLKNIPIEESYPTKYDRLLCGGIWCIVGLDYDYIEDNKKRPPISIRKLTPIQMPHIDITELKDGRSAFTKDEWITVMLRSTGIEPEKLSVDLRILRQILRVGMPAGIQSAMFSISNVIIQASVNSFGSLVTSGAAAAGSLEGFTWLPMNAIYQASMYFTGQNYGAGQFDRIKRIYRTALAAVAVTGLCLGAGMYLLGPKLLSLYLPDSPEAIAYGMMRLRFVCLPYMLAGIQDVMTGVIRGMGHSLEPMLISVFGICGIRMLWVATAFQLPRFHNVGALYFSYPLSWAITFVLQSICFALLFRRYRGRG